MNYLSAALLIGLSLVGQASTSAKGVEYEFDVVVVKDDVVLFRADLHLSPKQSAAISSPDGTSVEIASAAGASSSETEARLMLAQDGKSTMLHRSRNPDPPSDRRVIRYAICNGSTTFSNVDVIPKCSTK